jgi:hypothetical protein
MEVGKGRSRKAGNIRGGAVMVWGGTGGAERDSCQAWTLDYLSYQRPERPPWLTAIMHRAMCRIPEAE